MYQVFVEKYATMTLLALLALTAGCVGVSALGAYMAYRQTASRRFSSIQLVQAMRNSLTLSTATVTLCAIALFALSPKIGVVALGTGIVVALLSHLVSYCPSVSDSALRGCTGMMLFAALFLFIQSNYALMPLLYAFLAILPLGLLKVHDRYEHKLFVLLYWD